MRSFRRTGCALRGARSARLDRASVCPRAVIASRVDRAAVSSRLAMSRSRRGERRAMPQDGVSRLWLASVEWQAVGHGGHARRAAADRFARRFRLDRIDMPQAILPPWRRCAARTGRASFGAPYVGTSNETTSSSRAPNGCQGTRPQVCMPQAGAADRSGSQSPGALRSRPSREGDQTTRESGDRARPPPMGVRGRS